jgi:hypothetical protein
MSDLLDVDENKGETAKVAKTIIRVYHYKNDNPSFNCRFGLAYTPLERGMQFREFQTDALPDIVNVYYNLNGNNYMTEPTKEELLARIAELEKQASSKKSGRMEFRVSEKGGVSVYGLGRFPVTLYYEQWVRLLESSEALRNFLEENKPKLKLKGTD